MRQCDRKGRVDDLWISAQITRDFQIEPIYGCKISHRWHDSMDNRSILNDLITHTSRLHSSWAPTMPLWACGAIPCGGSRPSDSFLSSFEGRDHAVGASTGFMVASGGVLSEGYGAGVCLGDGQTEAEGVPSQGGRDDALLRRMPPYLTWPGLITHKWNDHQLTNHGKMTGSVNYPSANYQSKCWNNYLLMAWLCIA